jgi:choline dehydrogenase-like flavoprotein
VAHVARAARLNGKPERVQVDARQLAPGTQVEADVAIVGAGPAGIVLALELSAVGHRVVLIESGGDTFDADLQRLGDTGGEDPPHAPMSLTTRRQVGGASNLWAGRCVPFDPIDFQPRKITGCARWPVDYDELEGRFARACEWFACGAAVFDAERVANLAGRSLIPGWPGGDIRATALERWSLPTNFGQRYGPRLRASALVTLLTGLTCTEIVCASDGRSVMYLTGQTLGGGRVTIRAARYVLACGGLETTRLLFASDRLHPGGIGNHSGHLGRWYMAHVESRIARIHLTTPPGRTIYDFERDPDGVYVRRRFTFSPEFLVEHELPNTAMWLVNPELGDPSHRNGILSFLYLVLASPFGRHLLSEAIRLGQLKTARPISKRSHLANLARDLGPTARFALSFGYRRFVKRGRKVPGVFVPSASNVYPLLYHGEHLPNYDSHVAPTSERDALGMPRLRTSLRFGDADVRGVVAAHTHLDGYLERHGLGHLEYLYENPQEPIREQLFGGYHQAGTTRMSADPEDGVLTPDLAVHGFDDLFVASSSAFVTSSQANTTFMIVVFALRLADHLHRTLRAPRATASHG